MTRPRTANRVPWWRHRDSGQVGLFIVAVLGMFLVGFVGFGVEMTNWWFHRQAAQGAADAACIAGAMDMLVQAGGSASGGLDRAHRFQCAQLSIVRPLRRRRRPASTPP